jgi:hypothetical protein
MATFGISGIVDTNEFDLIAAYTHRPRGGGGFPGRRQRFTFSDDFTAYTVGQRLTVAAPTVWQTYQLDLATATDFALVTAAGGGGIDFDPTSVNQPVYCYPRVLGPDSSAPDVAKGYTMALDFTFTATTGGSCGLDFEGAPSAGSTNKYGYHATVSMGGGFSSLVVQDAGGGVIYNNNPDIGQGAGIMPANIRRTLKIVMSASPAAGNRTLQVFINNVLIVTSALISRVPNVNNPAWFGCEVADASDRATINKFSFDGLL